MTGASSRMAKAPAQLVRVAGIARQSPPQVRVKSGDVRATRMIVAGGRTLAPVHEKELRLVVLGVIETQVGSIVCRTTDGGVTGLRVVTNTRRAPAPNRCRRTERTQDRSSHRKRRSAKSRWRRKQVCKQPASPGADPPGVRQGRRWHLEQALRLVPSTRGNTPVPILFPRTVLGHEESPRLPRNYAGFGGFQAGGDGGI